MADEVVLLPENKLANVGKKSGTKCGANSHSNTTTNKREVTGNNSTCNNNMQYNEMPN